MQSKGKPFHILFINGPIASGKDTQAKMLIKGDNRGVRISPGDIIRDAQNDPTHPYRHLLEEHFDVLNSGELVPAEIMVGIVADIISLERKNGKETFIVTGFPRSNEYLDVLDPVLKKYEDENGAKVDFAYLEITQVESWNRTKARAEASKRKKSGVRPEDNEAAFERRSMIFERSTIPVMQRLLVEGRMFKIRAMGEAKETQEALRANLKWDEIHPRREGSLPAAAKR